MPGSRARPPSRTTATTVATLPAALPRGLLIMLGLAAVTVTIGGIRAVSDIAAPAFLALVLSIAVHPVRGWLVRHRAPGWLATVGVGCVVVAGIGAERGGARPPLPPATPG